MGSQGNIIISITGDLGSGKSTICDIIEEKHGFKRYSTGRIQRAIAEKYGMDTLELNKYTETHPEIDQEIDDGLRALSHVREDMIIDSRLAWHFVPDSFKVFLIVDIREAAKRVLADQDRGAVEHYENMDDAIERLSARKESENSRYLQLYGVDCSDLGNYDLVIDSTLLSPGEITDIILTACSAGRGERGVCLYASPKTLYPAGDVKEIYLNTGNIPLGPVIAVRVNGSTYVLEGHDRVAALIAKGCTYAKCQVLARDDEVLPSGITAREFVEKNCSMRNIKAWEQAIGFTYLYYPR